MHDISDQKCPKCGAFMFWEDEWHDVLICPKCSYDFSPWRIEDDDEIDIPFYENVPEGCAACGGPYPDCTTSCNLFDD